MITQNTLKYEQDDHNTKITSKSVIKNENMPLISTKAFSLDKTNDYNKTKTYNIKNQLKNNFSSSKNIPINSLNQESIDSKEVKETNLKKKIPEKRKIYIGTEKENNIDNTPRNCDIIKILTSRNTNSNCFLTSSFDSYDNFKNDFEYEHRVPMTPIINNNTFIKLKMKRFETISSSACDNRKKINSIKGAKKINLLLKENKAPIKLFSPDKNLTTNNSQNIQKTYINLQTLQTSREKLSINIYDKSDCEKDYKDKDILTDRGQRTDYLRMNTRNVNANNTHLTFNKLLNNNNNYNININNSNINYNHHSKINNNLTTTKNNNKSIKLNLHQLHSPTKIKYEHPLCASTNDNITNDSLNKDPSPPSVPSIRHSNPLSIITNTTIDENKKYDEVDSRTLSPLTPLANMKINFNSFNFMGKNKNSNISNNSNNEDYTKNTNINNMFVNLHTNTHNTSASSSFKGDSSYPGSDIENFIKNFKGNYENKEKNINDNSGLIKDINNKNISNINNTNNNIKNITKNNTKNNKSNTNNLIRYNTERYIKIDEKPSNSSNFSNVNNVSSGNNGRNVIELGNNKKISSSIDSLTNITENINTINNQNTFNNQNSISSSPEEESDLNNVSNKKNQVNELSSSTILSKSLNSIKISKEIPLIKIINNKPKIINSENLTPNSSREHYSNNLLKNEYNNSEEKYNKYISSKFNNEKFPSFRK